MPNEKNLLSEIELLKKELKRLKLRKKYGLVWEEKPEAVVELCKKELPVLIEDTKKEITRDKNRPTNILIEGDNYHALSVLNYTHKGKIDVIYVDPPYNTGNKSWKYNNNFVDKEDAFRHSKWISFVSKRIKLAKDLLKNDGIFIMTIDDYEIGALRLILDEIFGEQNRLGLVTIMHNPRGRSDDKYFATSHEYALFYSKNFKVVKTEKLPLTEEQIKLFKLEDDISFYRLLPLKRTGSNSTPNERANLYFPIYYNESTQEISLDAMKGEKWQEIIPLDSGGNKRVWRWGKEKISKEWKTEIVIKKVKNNWQAFGKDRIKAGRKPKTVWVDPRYDASSHGTMLLQKLLGERKIFDYPKSVWAVLDALSIACSDKKNASILDFFAGSGTTGHATMILNKKDNGNRNFILCTDNENKIAEKVCYPRIKKVIEGHKDYPDITNFEANLKYYKTDFVDAEQTDSNKKKLVDKSTEMLCLKEDCFDELKRTKTYSIFTNNQGKNLGIIYDDAGITPFKKEAEKIGKKFIVYVFSLDDSAREEEFEDIKNLVELKPIPAVILNVYKRIFK